MLSTPADFPFINDCTAASTSFQRIRWSSSVSVWGQFSTDGSPLALWLYSSEQYSVHRFRISCSFVRHFPERSWTVVAFLCFTVVKSFTSWYALLLLFFLRFSPISLHLLHKETILKTIWIYQHLLAVTQHCAFLVQEMCFEEYTTAYRVNIVIQTVLTRLGLVLFMYLTLSTEDISHPPLLENGLAGLFNFVC